MMVLLNVGSNTYRQLNGVPTDNGYTAIACGSGNHSIALKNDGILKYGVVMNNQFDNLPTENNFMTDYSLQQFDYYQNN